MSIWTHVNGNIRFDGIEYNNLPKVDDYDTPRGSEGPLEYHYQIVGTGFVMANLTIWGDLRDYDDVEEIIDWIKNITKNALVRSGVIEINAENRDSKILMYYGDYEWEIEQTKKEQL